MSFTPFNAPLLSGLFGDSEVAAFFSVKADLDAMLRFEVALAQAEAETGVIPADAAKHIASVAVHFSADIPRLQEATVRDGLAVPEFVRQLREAVGPPHDSKVHFASTSQDVIDTSLTLRLAVVNNILLHRLSATVDQIEALAEKFGSNQLMAQTRMQAALRVTVADRLGLWSVPLRQHIRRFDDLAPRLHTLQFAGPVGTLDKLADKSAVVRETLARNLELSDPGCSWHADRSILADYAHWLSLVAGTLGKIGQDIALMAQNERAEITCTGGGGSSAMAHKQNPVKAESLVTLARFTATLVSGMHLTLVHEQERSGAAWPLEWMLLPQLTVATGAALRNAGTLLSSISHIGSVER